MTTLRTNGITIYEYDSLVSSGLPIEAEGLHAVPARVFNWLEELCLRNSENGDAAWIRLVQRRGRRALQLTNYVGVIRCPDNFQLEVLPKVGKAIGGGAKDAQQLLMEMLRCLRGFRHIQTESARLKSVRMPLLEVFIAEFLAAVDRVVKRGLRSDYAIRQGSLFALRGKLMMATHLRENLHRADRFYTEHDEYSIDRPENRLIHAALRRALEYSVSRENQQLALELCFTFAEVPISTQVRVDFQRVRVDRGMTHYGDSLAWARLLLDEDSPLTGSGRNRAPSLLFPMEAVFEAYVAKHLPAQLMPNLQLSTQARSHHLVRHIDQDWFLLKPDLVIRNKEQNICVLDTKWKLLDRNKGTGADKYELSQADFYQLQAYGQSYLDGVGDVVLIYPKTDNFSEPLPVFAFPKTEGLRLWVVPFCLKTRQLLLPPDAPFSTAFQAASPTTGIFSSVAFAAHVIPAETAQTAS